MNLFWRNRCSLPNQSKSLRLERKSLDKPEKEKNESTLKITRNITILSNIRGNNYIANKLSESLKLTMDSYRKDKSYISSINKLYKKSTFHILKNSLSTKLYFSSITKKDFQMNKSIFEKGKSILYSNNFELPEHVPDLKFFIQRYYYYHKYDEGIKMDSESILTNNILQRLVFSNPRGTSCLYCIEMH